eukprot:tig00000123_g6929.t1
MAAHINCNCNAMAIGQGGWPSEFFEPGEEAKASGLELVCSICLLVMREPTLLGCSNDHALCRACAERMAEGKGYPFQYEYMKESLWCPVDREVVDRERFRPAPFVSRQISDLRVHCRFLERGCKWRGNVGTFAAHVERCPEGWGVCRCCGARVCIVELEAHEAVCQRPCLNADVGCTAQLSILDREAHLGLCLRDLFARLALEKDELAGEKADLAQKNADLSQERDDLVARFAREKGTLEQQAEDLSSQLEAMRLRAEAAETRLAAAQREKDELAGEKADLAQKNADLSQERDDLVARFAREKGTLEQQAEDLSSQLEVMWLHAEAAETQLAAAQREKDELAGEKADLAQKNADLSQERDDLVARFAREKGTLEQQAEDLSSQLEAMRLCAEVAASSDTAADSAVEVQVQRGESIMNAVRLAAIGQTIRLAPGLHREQVLLTKDVRIVGSRDAVLEWGRGTTLSFAGSAMPSVSGITIRSIGDKCAVEIHARSRAVVEDCDVSSSAIGIYVRDEGTAPTLRRNVVHDCGGVAFRFERQACGMAEGNDIYGNVGLGFLTVGGADPVIQGNRIHDQRFGICVAEQGKGTVKENMLERISNPLYASCGGVNVLPGSACVVNGNTFHQN